MTLFLPYLAHNYKLVLTHSLKPCFSWGTLRAAEAALFYGGTASLAFFERIFLGAL